MKIVNLSGHRLDHDSLQKVLQKYSQSSKANYELYSQRHTFTAEFGIRNGYDALLASYGLTLMDIDSDTVLIVPNIKNADVAARQMFGELPQIVVITQLLDRTKSQKSFSAKDHFELYPIHAH
jgi:hypothetical protein